MIVGVWNLASSDKGGHASVRLGKEKRVFLRNDKRRDSNPGLGKRNQGRHPLVPRGLHPLH